MAMTNHTDVQNDQQNQTVCNKYMDGQAPLLLLIAVLENLIILICLPSLHTSRSSYTHRIVLLLSANDLLGCSALLISSIWDAAVCRGFGDTVMCNVLGLIGFASMCWSVMIVVVISIDRCIMVHWPLKHRANCNFSQLFIGSLVGFGVLTAIMVMPLVGIGDSYFYYDVNGFCAFSLVTDCSPIHLVLIALIGSLLSLSVIIIICCNAAMLLTLRRRSKWLVKHGSSKTNSNQKAAKENPHAAAFQKLTVAIALINLILVLPFTIRVCVDVFLKKEHQDHIEDHITAALLFLSPVVNPIVYVAVNALYRKHIYWCFIKFVTCCCSQFAQRNSALRSARYQYKVTYSSHSGQDSVNNSAGNNNNIVMNNNKVTVTSHIQDDAL